MKKIDINDEEQILKECDFDYFYNSERCSRELNMFYYDIYNQNANFNKKQALIDLGRIAITLNEQDEKIKELEEEIKNQNKVIWDENDKAVLCGDCYCLNNDVRKLVEENQQLKQQLEEKDKEIKRLLNNWKNSKLQQTRLYNELKQSQNSKAIEVLERAKIEFETYYADNIWNYPDWIDNQITELRGGEND